MSLPKIIINSCIKMSSIKTFPSTRFDISFVPMNLALEMECPTADIFVWVGSEEEITTMKQTLTNLPTTDLYHLAVHDTGDYTIMYVGHFTSPVGKGRSTKCIRHNLELMEDIFGTILMHKSHRTRTNNVPTDYFCTTFE